MAIYYQNQFRNYYLGSTGSLGAMYYGNVEVNPGSTAAPSLWTPADLSNLYIWWSADTGITTSGTNVTSWVSKAGVISRTLTQVAGTTATVYNSSDSSFNNKPTVTFPSNKNGCLSFYDTNSGLANDASLTVSVCFIMSPEAPTSGYALMGGFTSTGGAYGELVPATSVTGNPGYYSTYVFTGGQRATDTLMVNGGAQFIISDYSNTDLKIYPNSTTAYEAGTTSLAAAGLSNCVWSLGGYGDSGGGFFGGAGYSGKIMEMIITTGTRWTAQDLSDLSNYVNTYY
jgi:hypothetical protein